MAPGFLENSKVRSWLGGVEPAWTLLDQTSFHALRRPPSPTTGPIRLAADLTREETDLSAVARNALILLHAATVGGGLKRTATGNLSRAVVAEMCNLFTWPDFEKDREFQFNKVINEPDFLPLYFVRHIAEAGKLLRQYKGHLKTTPDGRKMLREPNQQALQAILFHIVLWHLDLGYLSRGLHRGWLQSDIGIIIWSLSVAANDWQPRERLTRLCTIPNPGVLESSWDTASYAMEAQVLRPLQWFGLLEHKQDAITAGQLETRHLYRKTALFDRFLSFEVTLETATGAHH